MRKVIAPTDTRLRGDERLYEEGKVDEADEEKVRLEVKQRKARKIREEGDGIWVPNFFKEISHPYAEGEKHFEFIQENNYWIRREQRNWDNLPDLW